MLITKSEKFKVLSLPCNNLIKFVTNIYLYTQQVMFKPYGFYTNHVRYDNFEDFMMGIGVKVYKNLHCYNKAIIMNWHNWWYRKSYFLYYFNVERVNKILVYFQKPQTNWVQNMNIYAYYNHARKTKICHTLIIYIISICFATSKGTSMVLFYTEIFQLLLSAWKRYIGDFIKKTWLYHGRHHWCFPHAFTLRSLRR